MDQFGVMWMCHAFLTPLLAAQYSFLDSFIQLMDAEILPSMAISVTAHSSEQQIDEKEAMSPS